MLIIAVMKGIFGPSWNGVQKNRATLQYSLTFHPPSLSLRRDEQELLKASPHNSIKSIASNAGGTTYMEKDLADLTKMPMRMLFFRGHELDGETS